MESTTFITRLAKFYSGHRQIVLLAFLWLLVALLVNPSGEFPLNDDWAYAGPVKTLGEEGWLEISQWPSMTLIAHIGWGWLVSFIFGFSFTALRLSVALLGFGGMIAVWRVLRNLTGDDQKAMLGALTIGFNGIYFNLSYTFMTDVPYFFCAMWAMYFYMRYLQEKHINWLAGATLTASAAVLIRQIGLFIPAAFMIAMLVRERGTLRAWITGACSCVFVYGAMRAGERWMEVAGRVSNKIYQSYISEVWGKITAGPAALLNESADTMIVCLIMLGLFVFPVLLVAMPLRSRRDRIIAGILTAGGLALGAWLASEGRKLPLLSKGIFVDFALGPPLLRDVFYLERDNLYKAPPFLLWLITFTGCIGAAWLLRHVFVSAWNGCRWLCGGRGDGFQASAQVLGVGAAAIVFLPLAIKYPFDRYLLACVPGLLIGVAASSAFTAPSLRWQKWAASLFVMASAVFAVAGTHDYLAWNRARWQALDYLCKECKIPPARIDGGMEFNGWHLYDPFYRSSAPKSWWWVHDDEFIIAFGLVEHHRINKSFPYIRWCPPMRDFIAIIEYCDLHADHIRLASTARDGGRNIKTPDGNILRYWNGRSAQVNIAHGGYVWLKPGAYRARFTFAAGKNGSGHNAGIFRVIDYDNGHLLTEAGILNAGHGPRQFINQDLPFCIAANAKVGVHVVSGKTPLWLDTVRFIPEFESE